MKKALSILAAVAVIAGMLSLVALAADAAGEPELSRVVTVVATLLAGAIGVPITQIFKKLLDKVIPGISGKFITYIAYGTAFVISIVVFAVFGGLKELLANPLVVLSEGSTAFAIMQLVYTTLKDKLGLSR